MDWYVREVENGDMALAYIAVVTILFLVVGGLGGFPLRRLVERAVRARGGNRQLDRLTVLLQVGWAGAAILASLAAARLLDPWVESQPQGSSTVLLVLLIWAAGTAVVIAAGARVIGWIMKKKRH